MEEEVRRSPEARRLRKQSFFWGLGANLEGFVTALLLIAMLGASIFFWGRRLSPEISAPKQATATFVEEEFKGLVLPHSTGLEVKLYRPEAQLWWFFYKPPRRSGTPLSALADQVANNHWKLTAKRVNEIELEREIDSRGKYIALARWRRPSKKLEFFVTIAPIKMPARERWRQVNIMVGIDRLERTER